VKGERGGMVFLVLVMLVWGVNISVMKTAVAELPPQAFNALRFPLGAIVLALLVWRLEPNSWPRADEWGTLVLTGVMAHPLYQLCFLNGLALTSASHTGIIIATTPVWVALVDRGLGHEPLPRRAWGGILLSLAGVAAVVLSRGRAAGHVSLLGDALVLAGCWLWTGYVILSRKLLRGRSPLWVTGWALFIGAPLVVLLGIPQLAAVDWARVSAGTWAGVLYAGLLALATAYSWWAIGLQRLGASRTAVFSNLNPVVALVVAWLWLGERLAAPAWVGAAVVLAGVWLTSTSRSPASRVVQPD
jgi:drug/metabolite transporter (DMT)-like permease